MKRYISLCLFLFLCAGSAWGATYYVDTAANGDAGAGTSTAANVAWKTIAKVNASSFSAGDSILFKRGCTWRETLTVPSSGSAGSPITFGAYGTGAKPIIDPSYTPVTWTPETITATFAWEDSITFENAPGANTQWSAWWVNGIANGEDDATVYHGGAHSRLFNKVGEQDRRDANYDYVYCDFYYRVDSASVPSENNKVEVIRVYNGITNLWLRYNTSKYWLDISNNTTVANTVELTPDTWYHIEFIWKKGNGTGSTELKVDGISVKTLSSQSYANTATIFYIGNSGGYNPDKFKTNIDDINTTMTAPSTFTAYHAPWTTAHPHGVWNGTTMFKEVATKEVLTAANKFFNDADTVYVRLSGETDPSTQTMYLGKLYSPISIGNIEYVTIDGLSIQHGNGPTGGNILFTDGTTHSHIKITNCDIGYGASGGIFLDGTGHDIEISNNNIYYNVNNLIRTASPTSATSGYGINFYTFTNDDGAANPILIHHNNIYNNGPRAGIEIGTPTTYVYVYNNHIYDNGEDASYYGSAITVGGADTGYCKFYNNLIHGHLGYNPDGNGIVLDTNSHDNEVHHNVIYGNAGGGIRVNDSWHANIYNNTTYNNMLTSTTNPGEIALTTSAADTTHGIVVKNNISYAVKAGVYAILVDGRTAANADMSITNNLWYRTSGNWYFFNATPGATLATWNAVDAMIGTDLNPDPILTATYALGAGSPAIDAGVAITGLTQDFAGSPIYGLPDIGAFETPIGPRLVQTTNIGGVSMH